MFKFWPLVTDTVTDADFNLLFGIRYVTILQQTVLQRSKSTNREKRVSGLKSHHLPHHPTKGRFEPKIHISAVVPCVDLGIIDSKPPCSGVIGTGVVSTAKHSFPDFVDFDHCIQIKNRQAFFWGKLISNLRYRIVLTEELVSIAETDPWKCCRKPLFADTDSLLISRECPLQRQTSGWKRINSVVISTTKVRGGRIPKY